MKKSDRVYWIAAMVVALILAWAIGRSYGFRDGQLKAALGVRYYFDDANGYEVHDPMLMLRSPK